MNYISFIKRNDVANAQGLYAIRLRICKDRQRKYFALKIFADDKYWDADHECFIILKNVRDKKQKEENEQRKQYNYMLSSIRTRAQEIIDNFHHEHIDWTLNQFADAFLNRAKQGKIKAYLENHISILRETGHTGNANCYAATLNMLEHYDKKFEKRAFSEIGIKYVNGFDVFLQKRGCKGNTRKYYFKALRSILNKAIQEKEATEKTYPFGKGGFQIAKLDEETEKRYLSIESLNRIKNTASNKPQREFARKLFLLSYYCYDIYRYQNRIDFDELISKIDEEDVRNFLLALLSDPFRMTKYDEKFFLDSVNKIRECTYQEQIDLINQKIIQSVDNQEKLELARQKREWIIKKNGLRKEG